MTEKFLLDCRVMLEENIKSIRREARKGYRIMGRGAVIADFKDKKLVRTSYLPIVVLRRQGWDDEDLRLVIKYEPPLQTVIMTSLEEKEENLGNMGFHLINFLEPTEQQAKNKGFGKKADKLHEYLDLTKKVERIYLTDPEFFTRRSDAIDKSIGKFRAQLEQHKAKKVTSDTRQ